MNERAVMFRCAAQPLVGIVHAADSDCELGVVIIVAGGPQYRVGAHRQFVMLARQLAAAGIPVLRFDHRGTGDSGGECRGFTDMEEDIRCAIDQLVERVPGIRKVALWGECESASAAAYYAPTDERVCGVFMVNPWIRTEAGLAKTQLRHHYRGRLSDPEFWAKLRSGKFSFKESLTSMAGLVATALKDRAGARRSKSANDADDLSKLPLPIRLERSLDRFGDNIFILTSGRDHIAKEFTDFFRVSKLWRERKRLGNVIETEIADADHTFSRTAWRQELFGLTERWLADTMASSGKRPGHE